ACVNVDDDHPWPAAGSDQALQGPPERVGQGHWPTCLPVHVDMDKVTTGRGQGFVPGEQPDVVAHAGVAQVRHAQPGFNGLRKSQRSEVVALCLDHQADDLATVDIQYALLDQPAIDGRIEPAVVHDIVDMA